jgi:DNA processing protein
MESDQYLGMVGAGVDAWPRRSHDRNAIAGIRQPGGHLQRFTDGTGGAAASPAVAEAIHTRQPLSDAAKELAMVRAAACRLLTWDEAEYPRQLREIYDPTTLLYVLGNVQLLCRHLISIVAARRPTPYGNQMAERLGRDLGDRGLVITSGLARGTGSCAHKGALSSPTGATNGVLGCGSDVVYPKEKQENCRGHREARRDHQ